MSTSYVVVNTKGSALNLRSSPNTSSGILAKIPNKAIVEQNFVLTAEDGWTAVSYNGKSGYVNNSYIVKKENTTNQNLTNPTKKMEQELNGGITLSDTTKKWLKIGLIGIAVIGIAAVAIKVSKKKPSVSYTPAPAALNGIGRYRKKKSRKRTTVSKKIKLK